MLGHPGINSEVSINGGLVDIVAERFDAGVRLGEQVAKDMIAVRIGANLRMAIVGAPSYFAKRPRPQQPEDLVKHECINIRLPTSGAINGWEFAKDGREVSVRVGGRLVVNSGWLRLHAALDGAGLARLPENQVAQHVEEGQLVRVLEDWCEYFPGYHLYYPSRHHSSSAFSLLVEALRYRV
jgi:DNA-binding transcriptional LysR family regulator